MFNRILAAIIALVTLGAAISLAIVATLTITVNVENNVGQGGTTLSTQLI